MLARRPGETGCRRKRIEARFLGRGLCIRHDRPYGLLREDFEWRLGNPDFQLHLSRLQVQRQGLNGERSGALHTQRQGCNRARQVQPSGRSKHRKRRGKDGDTEQRGHMHQQRGYPGTALAEQLPAPGLQRRGLNGRSFSRTGSRRSQRYPRSRKYCLFRQERLALLVSCKRNPLPSKPDRCLRPTDQQ